MMYSNLQKTLLQMVTTVALLLCLNATQAQVTAYDESVDGDLGGILTISNPDPVTLPSPSASSLVFDVKGSLSATDVNDFFKFTVPAGFRLESIQMVQLTRTFGLAATNVDVFFYDKNNASPLTSFVASLLNLTTGSSTNLISSLSPPLDAGTYTVRVDRDGGSWNYGVRITLSCVPLKMAFAFTNPSNFDGEICNGGIVDIDLLLATEFQSLGLKEGTDYRFEVVSVNWSTTGSNNADFTGNNGYGPVSGGTLVNGATTSGVNETLSHNQTGPVWIRYNFVLRNLNCASNNFRSVVVRVRPVLKLQFSFTNPSNFGGEICNGGTVSIGLDALTAQ